MDRYEGTCIYFVFLILLGGDNMTVNIYVDRYMFCKKKNPRAEDYLAGLKLIFLEKSTEHRN